MTSPELRASDADRERVATRLREHLADGRLTLDELSERLDAAYKARTVGELDALMQDLPAERTAAAPATSSGEPVRSVVAVMSHSTRERRWRVPEELNAIALMGQVDLDLRRAELSSNEVEIRAVAVMGGVEIVVPEGVDVEVSGFALMGEKNERVADAPVPPGAPRIHVRAYVVMGSVRVRSKPRLGGPHGDRHHGHVSRHEED